MPGKDSYGPGGKWVHDRAHGIMQDNPEMPKSEAYAISVQQGHKVGKTPKDFRTPQGVHEAKKKYDEPKSEYQKTAMWAAFFDEFEGIKKEAINLKQVAVGGMLGLGALGGGKAALGHVATHAAPGMTQMVKKTVAPRAILGGGGSTMKRLAAEPGMNTSIMP